MAIGMTQIRVLFLCIHNSARSQMAQAYLQKMGGSRFIVESAGLEAGQLNPYAIKAMKLDEIDISKNKTTNVLDYFNEGRRYDYVITVCDEASAAMCPVFPGKHKKINWSFADPSAFNGTDDDKLQQTIAVRNKIKESVISLIKSFE